MQAAAARQYDVPVTTWMIPIPEGFYAKISKDALYSQLLRNAININTAKQYPHKKAPYLPSFLATLLCCSVLPSLTHAQLPGQLVTSHPRS